MVLQPHSKEWKHGAPQKVYMVAHSAIQQRPPVETALS